MFDTITFVDTKVFVDLIMFKVSNLSVCIQIDVTRLTELATLKAEFCTFVKFKLHAYVVAEVFHDGEKVFQITVIFSE